MKKLSDSKIEMCDCLSASRLRLQSEINPLDGGYSRPDVLGSRPCQSRTHLVQGGSSELCSESEVSEPETVVWSILVPDF